MLADSTVTEANRKINFGKYIVSETIKTKYIIVII